MHDTVHTLPKKTRAAMVELLQARLFDTVDAFTQAKHAHWNVKGPGFIALHELFDKVAAQLAGHADEIAERLTTLGGIAAGTARRVAKATTLPEYPGSIASGRDHVKTLSAALAQLATTYRAAIDAADKHDDKVTADLFTGSAGELDKSVWMIEAHRQAKD